MNEHTYTLAQFKKWLIENKDDAHSATLIHIVSLETDFIIDGVTDGDISIIAEIKRWLIKKNTDNNCYSFERDYYLDILFQLIKLEVEAVLGEDDLQPAQEEANAQTD